MGKSSKLVDNLKNRKSKSSLAGLTFPVSRVGNMIKKHSPHFRIG